MGLDMYLTASGYTSASSAKRNPQEQERYEALLEILQCENYISDNLGFIEYEVEVAYWRKANAIHGWFVQHCQDGVDNCEKHYVTRERMMELITLCKKVLNNPSLADELLPPHPGFFFGSYEIDDWYESSLKDTVQMLEHALINVPDNMQFCYRSSW
jgi:hypothetical protein